MLTCKSSLAAKPQNQHGHHPAGMLRSTLATAAQGKDINIMQNPEFTAPVLHA